jgi:peptidyl-prolyl cis-trans isomerase D
MLQDIRKSTQGTAAKIVIGLIVASFSLFGIQSILVSGSGGGIAEVNGEQIYSGELQQLVNTQKRRLISMMGENLDPSLLDDQRLNSQALESLISRKLQMQAAAEMTLGVSEQQIGMIIASMEQFQVDGQFSPEAYKSILSGAGYTPASFKQGLIEDLLLNQLSSGLAGSDFATSKEMALNAAYTAESRDVRYLTIPLERFTTELEVSEEQIQQYFEDNEADFRTRESVDLEYIQLSLDDFRRPVEEAVLQEQYQLEQENYQYQTQSTVSHILFERGGDESDEAFAARIQAVQDQLAAGSDFSELAKTASDDIGSASFGGDLGPTLGDTFPEEMEAAIAELSIDEVSGPVETDAGTHLIKLTAQIAGEMPPLEELRGELEDRVQVQEARRELTSVVERLKDLAFNAEDLNGPAEELDLEVLKESGVSRSHEEGLFASATLLSAAFSEEVLEQGHNSDVLELGKETYVALRVRKHNEPTPRPLSEVRDQIVFQITDETARAAVVAAADAALEQIPAQGGIEAFANAHDYQWQVELAATRGNAMVPRQVLQRAFELPAPAGEQTTLEYVLTTTGDVQVFELARVTPGDLAALNPGQKKQLKDQLLSEHGGMVNSEFSRALRDRADISVL